MKFRQFGTEPANIRSSLVLSGGGAKGAYQIGVIKKFLENNTTFDLIIGSSIGAFNGALLAEFVLQGLNCREISYKLEDIWFNMVNILPLNWFGLLKNIFTPGRIPSIYDNKALKSLISKYIPGERRFSDYKVSQLSLTGTNLSKKKLEIFDFNSTTPVIDALLASMTYPVAFPPVKIINDFFIDGGVLSNAPLKEAILWGSRNVYMVFLQPLSIVEGIPKESNSDCLSIFEVIEEFIELASNQLMYGDLKNVKRINNLIKLINKYQYSLPESFLIELRKIFGLKFKERKRFIKIIEIAPDEILDPPGLKGFCYREAIKEIMKKGENDAVLK
ncbi:MAG: patatin-like phospholipase family protein [Halanaerobiaceae bacterium]